VKRVISRTIPVTNTLGMHARAAARFVHTASTFAAQVRVARGARVMDGKSIMGLLLLAAAQGTEITISADGADEADAVDTLCRLVQSGFGEEPCSV
jgi:phosphocarrier protein